MPEKQTLQRARRDQREGKAPSTQAGEFVREEMHHIRRGKHGARSPEQAIAIGLSKARRSGVNLQPPEKGEGSERTRESAKSAFRRRGRKTSPRRSRAVLPFADVIDLFANEFARLRRRSFPFALVFSRSL